MVIHQVLKKENKLNHIEIFLQNPTWYIFRHFEKDFIEHDNTILLSKDSQINNVFYYGSVSTMIVSFYYVWNKNT